MLKYKIYNNNFLPISYSELPLFRLLKFKRSKWKRLKSKIKKQKFKLRRFFLKPKDQPKKLKRQSFKRRFFFKFGKKLKKKINKKSKRKLFTRGTSLTLVRDFKRNFKFYEKAKKAFKTGLLQKNSMNQFYGDALSLKYLKKQILLRRMGFYKFLIHPFLKLDILLWKLKFFYNIKDAQHHIKAKNIAVNGLVVNTCNFFLKGGDVVSILKKKIHVLKKYKIRKPRSSILSFCDVDFYANKIIILKKIADLTAWDLKLIFESLFVLRNYIYYLKKK